MAKKKKSTALSWCWYCDRTFEDDKVLLQHQKAKHFRCPHCPRRLNTAGGLSVHIDQVHKLGTDKIENALPGRDSFDIEIYGMEGIPAADLAAWKKRQGDTTGAAATEHRPKKLKYSTAPLTAEEIRVQLAAHKALMSGQPVPGSLPPLGYGVPPPSFGIPPPGFPGFLPPPGMPAPPPGFIPPQPGMMPFPPPPFGALPPGIPPPPPGMMFPPPGMPFPPPGQFLPQGSSPFPPPPPGAFAGGPPGFPGGLPFPPPPPGVAFPGFPPQPHPQAPALAVNIPTGPAALRGNANKENVIEEVPSSSVMQKPGTLLVYGDNEVSPEEKRARLSQYRVEDEEDVKPLSPSSQADANSKKRARATDFLEA